MNVNLTNDDRSILWNGLKTFSYYKMKNNKNRWFGLNLEHIIAFIVYNTMVNFEETYIKEK